MTSDKSDDELDALLTPLLSLPAEEGLDALEACLDSNTSWIDVQEWCYEMLGKDPRNIAVCRLLGHARDLGPPHHDYRCMSFSCPGCG